MRKEILTDVMHHGLRRLCDNDTADGCKQHIDKDRDTQQERETDEFIHLPLRDGVIHGIGDDHGAGEADDTADAAEQQGGEHLALAPHDIHHNLFQVFKI